MRALVADGRSAAALAAYDGLAGRLREDLGIDPARHGRAAPGDPAGESLPTREPGETRTRPRRWSVERRARHRRRDWVEAGDGAGTGSSSRASAGSARPGCSTRRQTSPTQRRTRAARAVPPGRAVAFPAAVRRRPASRALRACRRTARRPPARAHGSVGQAVARAGRAGRSACPRLRRSRDRARRAYDAVAAVLGRLARRGRCS